MAIGVGLVVVLIAAFALLGRGGGDKSGQVDPYLQKLEVGGLHMATAENFAGGSVTYVEGRVANTGDRKVTGARMEIVFKNTLGEVVQKEVTPLLVLISSTPYMDYGSLDRAPLAAGQVRDFRLALEHISNDWDGQLPQVKVVSAAY